MRENFHKKVEIKDKSFRSNSTNLQRNSLHFHKNENDISNFQRNSLLLSPKENLNNLDEERMIFMNPIHTLNSGGRQFIKQKY